MKVFTSEKEPAEISREVMRRGRDFLEHQRANDLMAALGDFVNLGTTPDERVSRSRWVDVAYKSIFEYRRAQLQIRGSVHE